MNTAIDNIQKNIEKVSEVFNFDIVFGENSPAEKNVKDFIKQSHISFIKNEIERLEGEKGTIKINLRKINEIERIESITIPQDYESSYFLGRKIALQDQIDNNKKTLALIKEL